MRKILYLLPISYLLLQSCTPAQRISKQAHQLLLKDSAISTGHIGISIFDPSSGKYLYDHNGTHYFIPASNTKLATCYAAMKYLGDSLKGIRYYDNGNTVTVMPTGDPTFLHPDYKRQPVLDFMRNEKKNMTIDVPGNWYENALGFGWSWDDYLSEDMAERSPLPVYGNVLKIGYYRVASEYFKQLIVFPDSNRFSRDFSFTRERTKNIFLAERTESRYNRQAIPFVTDGINTAIAILKSDHNISLNTGAEVIPAGQSSPPVWNTICSQPTDSMLKPMMHISDNFFAEQSLLMVSNEKLGYMKDAAIIDTLLKTDLKGLPQRPRWVDGCGLSRYNLFSPRDFVFILDKMRTEFGLERLKNILPTGGEGTFRNYYKHMAGSFFAKTGTLSNNCAASGFLITKKGKLLIFSVLANNYITGATPVRRAVERFLTYIRDNY